MAKCHVALPWAFLFGPFGANFVNPDNKKSPVREYIFLLLAIQAKYDPDEKSVQEDPLVVFVDHVEHIAALGRGFVADVIFVPGGFAD